MFKPPQITVLSTAAFFFACVTSHRSLQPLHPLHLRSSLSSCCCAALDGACTPSTTLSPLALFLGHYVEVRERVKDHKVILSENFSHLHVPTCDCSYDHFYDQK